MPKPSTHPLFQKLIQLGLNPADFAVFGSGPLYVHDLRSQIHDLDVIARGEAWEKAHLYGILQFSDSRHGLRIALAEGTIEIFNQWVSPKWSVDQLIDEAELIEGLRFVRLDKVLEAKQELNREKDREDIEKLKSYLTL